MVFTKKNYFYLIILSTLFLYIQISNNRFNMNDFQVYYRAGNRLLAQENLYRIISDGHYLFKYSPTFAFFSIPFSLLNIEVSKLFYWILMTGFVYFTLRSTYLFISKKETISNVNLQINISSLFLSIHFMREIDLGQVNLILASIYILGINLYLNKKFIAFSFLLAFSLFIKPFGLIWLPFLIINKNYRTIFILALFVLTFFVIPLTVVELKYLIIQNKMWIQEMQIELAQKKDLITEGNHTIFSIIARYTPFRYFSSFEFSSIILKALISIFILILNVYFFSKKPNSTWNLFFFLSWIPLLSYTSDNAFGAYSLPLIVMATYLIIEKKILWIVVPLFFVLMNPLEISHQPIFYFIHNYSIMGLSSIALILSIAYYRYKNII